MKIYRPIVTSVVALALVGCAQIAVVSEKHPGTLPPGSDKNQIAAQSIERGLAEENNQPIAALGEYVAAVRQSLAELDRNQKNVEAMRTYNFAIARIFGVIRDAKLDPWTHPLQVGAKGEFTLTWKRDPRPEWNLSLYQLIPTDELTIKGTYVEKRVTKDGIGAPLVAKRNLSDEQAAKLFIAPRIYYGITATAQFEGSRCVISVHDPWQTSTRSELTVTAILWRQILPRPTPCSSPGKSRRSSDSSVFSSPKNTPAPFGSRAWNPTIRIRLFFSLSMA